MADDSPESGGNGDKQGWQKKMMGLPMWGWTAIAAGGSIVAWLWWKNHQQNKANSQNNQNQSGSGNNPTAEGLGTEQFDELYALLQDIQGEESTEPHTGTNDNDDNDDNDSDDQGGKSTSSGGGKKKSPHYKIYTVKRGDTLSAIARRYHTTWQELYRFNTETAKQGGAGRPASTIAELKRRGPNKIYAGEKIYIPSK